MYDMRHQGHSQDFLKGISKNSIGLPEQGSRGTAPEQGFGGAAPSR